MNKECVVLILVFLEARYYKVFTCAWHQCKRTAAAICHPGGITLLTLPSLTAEEAEGDLHKVPAIPEAC